MQIELEATDRDGRFINHADAVVTITASDGKPRLVSLLQTAPGLYWASHRLAAPGTYWLEGQLRRDGKILESVQSGTVVLQVPPAAAKLEGPIAAETKSGLRTIYLWPWMLGVSLLVLLMDLAVKRLK